MTGPSPVVRPFVDAPVTDADRAARAADAAARHWGLPAPSLLRLGMNGLYECGAVIVRVSDPTAPAEAALDLVDALAGAGLRVPRAAFDDVVTSAGLSVTAWERIDQVSDTIDWRAVGGMIRRLHSLSPDDLPASVPLPRPESFPWWDFTGLLERARDGLDERSEAGLRAALRRHGGWHQVDERVVCHGDVHPGNVMMSADGPVLIDWDLLCLGPIGWDHGPMMTWSTRWGGLEGEYEAFADGYGRSLIGDPTAEAIAELRLAAATLMRVIAGLRDPAAMPEARRRLAYWRGDPDAPTWTAQ